MFKQIITAGLLLSLLMSQTLFGQAKTASMNQVLVFRPDQDVIRGKLVEIREESIIVLTSEREVAIPFSEISRMILNNERTTGRGPLYGAILAGYASTYALAQSEDQGGFVKSRDLSWYFLIVGPSIALGAGLGYLIDQGHVQTEEGFDFTGSDEAKAREKSRLRAAASHESRESKVHITFQGSHVYPNIPKLPLPGSSAYNNTTVSKFNVLRKAQITYSVMPELEAGVALVWFSEPPQYGFGYESLGNGNSRSSNATQSFKATGKYIVASYKPFPHILDPRIDFKVGVGIGTASIDYVRTTSVWTYRQVGTSVQENSSFSVSDNFFVSYLFGQIEFELVDGLSIGMVADKVFGPSREAPAVPEANVPAQVLRFDNASLGFTIGLHF